MTWSIARFLCDSWACCLYIYFTCTTNDL